MRENIYQGPGVYETTGGRRYEVLGTVGDPKVMRDKTQVVLREESDPGPILMLEDVRHFDRGGYWLCRVGPLKTREGS